MQRWEFICEQIHKKMNMERVRRLAREGYNEYGVYPDSIEVNEDAGFFITRDNSSKVLVVCGEHSLYGEFDGTETIIDGTKTKVCELSNGNCNILRRIFPYTNPTSHKGASITLGLGDRLGVASPGHLRLLKNKGVFPVIAQQSIRELNLTKRTYDDVLSAASWAVFQEGYKNGFGADGDHLKTIDEVRMALDCGFTMITLDCSEYIDNSAAGLFGYELEKQYLELPPADRQLLESKYLGNCFRLSDGTEIAFDFEGFRRTVLIYLKAIRFTIKIYTEVIKSCGREIDFEMSIDETLTSTLPESHFFVASELVNSGVDITSLAPRFCGEFQKGIDYRGDVNQFSREFAIHVKVAEHFGYKISVHSGSDKFSVFPIIGRLADGRYHLKTAGTNWLEALRVIAGKNPQLFRKIYIYAKENVHEAKKYYHIDASTENMPCIETLNDNELEATLDMDDCRQILHITYGLVLQARDEGDRLIFREELYHTLMLYENEYYIVLERHIGRHLERLGITDK